MFKKKYGVSPSFYMENQEAEEVMPEQDADRVKILLPRDDA